MASLGAPKHDLSHGREARRFDTFTNTVFRFAGVYSSGATPVPIPNTEVKPSSGDYTAIRGKLARCRIIRTTPGNRGFRSL